MESVEQVLAEQRVRLPVALLAHGAEMVEMIHDALDVGHPLRQQLGAHGLAARHVPPGQLMQVVEHRGLDLVDDVFVLVDRPRQRAAGVEQELQVHLQAGQAVAQQAVQFAHGGVQRALGGGEQRGVEVAGLALVPARRHHPAGQARESGADRQQDQRAQQHQRRVQVGRLAQQVGGQGLHRPDDPRHRRRAQRHVHHVEHLVPRRHAHRLGPAPERREPRRAARAEVRPQHDGIDLAEAGEHVRMNEREAHADHRAAALHGDGERAGGEGAQDQPPPGRAVDVGQPRASWSL
ncbi:MAG: hypothetical protein U1G05_05260 [Kiritimatiellia bacterium]